MKAIELKDIGNICCCESNKPTPAKGELLVKIMDSGICGSDVNRVYKDGAHNMPLIIGHEFSGQVVETGEDASNDWIGKRVSVFPLIPCQKCRQCQKQKYEMCENYSYLGSRRNGGMAEYVSVPKWNLLELPDNVSYEQAAMMEPMAVAVHAMRQVDINERDTVIVCGLGTIGLLLTMFLAERGIKNLFVIGNKDIQKRAAVEFGIPGSHFCDVRIEKVEDFIKNNTPKNGADVYFECIGTNNAINNAIIFTNPGGKICYVGNPSSDIQMDMKVYWQILRKQLTISGTWNSSYLGRAISLDNSSSNSSENSAKNTSKPDKTAGDKLAVDDWIYCLNKLEKNKIHPEKLISHRYDIEHIIEGLEIMRDKSEEYIKIMLENDK